jgi:hypothetical protein
MHQQENSQTNSQKDKVDLIISQMRQLQDQLSLLQKLQKDDVKPFVFYFELFCKKISHHYYYNLFY